MGVTYSTRKDYVIHEAVSIGLISIVPVIMVIVIVPMLIACCCDRAREAYYQFNRHIVTSVFSTAQVKVVERNANQGWEKTVFFAGRREPSSSCRSCYVYFYFVTMFCLIICWFVIVGWDNLWYRKTFTCNDIDANDESFICFDIHGGIDDTDSVVDCMDAGKDIDVVCYLVDVSPLKALGIAFGVVQAVAFAVSFGLRIALAVAERVRTIGVRRRNGVCTIVLQGLVAFFGGAGLILWVVLSHTGHLGKHHYFYGNLPTHWAAFICAVLSLFFGVILLPWACIRGSCFDPTEKELEEHFDTVNMPSEGYRQLQNPAES